MRKQPVTWVAGFGGCVEAWRGTLYLGKASPAFTPGHYIVQPIGALAFVAGNIETALRILEINRS